MSAGFLASPLRRVAPVFPAMLFLISSCGGSSTPVTSTPSADTTSTTVPAAPNLIVLPEFVQGVIPGEHLVLLVTLAESSDEQVTIAAEAPGADVTIEPASISGNQVAEVTVIPGPATVEGELTITVTAQGGGQSTSVTKTTPLVPWEDDRGEQGDLILGMFTPWLAEHHPELGITPDTEFAGTFVAPNLLVVSHYVFFSEAWEVGVSWHIMLAPDDFAEAYLRPRGALLPERAFRIASWQTARDTGVAEITEVAPPSEVVR